eukprot:2693576-Pyramimonas_sp.AAC.1
MEVVMYSHLPRYSRSALHAGPVPPAGRGPSLHCAYAVHCASCTAHHLSAFAMERGGMDGRAGGCHGNLSPERFSATPLPVLLETLGPS